MLALDQILSIIGRYKVLPTEGQVEGLLSIASDTSSVERWAQQGYSALDPSTQDNLTALIDFVVRPQLGSIASLGTSIPTLVPGPILYPIDYLSTVRGTTAQRDAQFHRHEVFELGSGKVLDIVNPKIALVKEVPGTEGPTNQTNFLDLSALIWAWHFMRAALHYRALSGRDEELNLDPETVGRFVKATGLYSDTWAWLRYLKSIDVGAGGLYGGLQWVGNLNIPIMGEGIKTSLDETALSPFLKASAEAELYGLPVSVNRIASGSQWDDPSLVDTVYNQVFLYRKGEDRVVTVSISRKGDPIWKTRNGPYLRPIVATSEGMGGDVLQTVISEIEALCLGLSRAINDPTVVVATNVPGWGPDGSTPTRPMTPLEVVDLAAAAAVTGPLLSTFFNALVATNRRTLASGSENYLQRPYPRKIDWNDVPERVKVQTSDARKSDFIALALPLARAVEAKYRIPVAVTLAQAALESSWGSSATGNNYFGIKKGSSWAGQTHIRRDDCGGCEFRSYSNAQESFDDYGRLISTAYPVSTLPVDNKEYTQWLDAIARAGYASSPAYANLTKQIVIDNNFDSLSNGDSGTDPAPSTSEGSLEAVRSQDKAERRKNKPRKRLSLGD